MSEIKNEIKNEVKNTETFDLQTMTPELLETLANEVGTDGNIPYDRVKIPSGGGIMFEIPGDEGEEAECVKEIKGVVLFSHAVNLYWEKDYNGEKVNPDCSSVDGIRGVVTETGEICDCKECPRNQYGSKANGRGKACKNARYLFVLREGNPLPIILTLPPSSLRAWSDFVTKKILVKGLKPYQTVVKISLKKAQNSSGIAYSKAVFTLDSVLPDDKALETSDMAEALAKCERHVEMIEAVPPAQIEEAHEEIPEGFTFMENPIPEDLPFK